MWMRWSSWHNPERAHGTICDSFLVGLRRVLRANFIERAEIIRDKGTNRKKFLRGEIDKYTWVDEGSSHVPSEMISAFLYAQLENAKYITNIRKEIWQEYHSNLEILEQKSKITRPIIPEGANHNGHIYYLLLPDNNIDHMEI